VEGPTETEKIALAELKQGLKGCLGLEIPEAHGLSEGALVLGTPSTSPLVAGMKLGKVLKRLGPEGYLIRSLKIRGFRLTVIAGENPRGCLSGAFHLLRLLETAQTLENLNILERPLVRRRLLNHWDNLDGTVERGYAGRSLWNWNELPKRISPRIKDYARACASIGLNGSVLNNVNADPRMLTLPYLEKAAAVAEVLRPYGIRVYLSANFAAPKALGGTATADPLDPGVIQWWGKKVEEIYRLIPDFGGFLVKANSEGQPGPLNYGRTHADGANLLAKALSPYGGIVIWRAFVYNDAVDKDRVKRAYLELKPLDGKFAKNVILQAKNGALDFQPREPFHPLFGGLARTPVAAELQVTQEYLGHSTHLVYLGTMWEEFLQSDTYAKGPGNKVAKIVEGIGTGLRGGLMSGVANTGDRRDWCGHPFAQANWYAFGRLAWNPRLRAEAVAEEWIRQTWGNDPEAVSVMSGIMMGSRQAFVDYASPLGLSGVFEKDLHYAPDPGMVDPRREDWSAAYFVRADKEGLGFNRTRGGSGAVDQYHKPLSDRFNSFKTCPEDYLLWFHHVKWDRRMRSGRTFWEELCFRYGRGVMETRKMKQDWESLKGKVDGERWRAVEGKLARQTEDAEAWRKKCLKYFQDFSGQPVLPLN